MDEGGSSGMGGNSGHVDIEVGSALAVHVDLEGGSPRLAGCYSNSLHDNNVGPLQTRPAEENELPVQDAEAKKLPVKDATVPSKPPRDYVLDNSKFFLTMCVVFTHTTGVFVGQRLFSTWFHDAMFVFMMPTYVFISGYCSSPDLSRTRKVDGIMKVAAIYFLSELFWLLIVFYGGPFLRTTFFGQVIQCAAEQFCDQDNQPGGMLWKAEDWVDPYWQLWYLLDLVFWRLMLPFWWRLKFPLVSAWLFSALFVGFQVNPTYGGLFTLDVNAILGWFPLFCLGTTAKARGWKLWASPWSRLVGLAVLLSFAWIPTASHRPQDNPIFGRDSQIWHYEGNLGALDDVTGSGFGGHCLKTLVRLGVPAVHALCVWGCLHVMPRREWRIITSFGSRSLANYIFHPLSGMLFSYLGLYGPNRSNFDMDQAPAWAEAAIIPLIVLTSLFWMSPWVWKLVWPVVDPPLHWILQTARDDAPARCGWHCLTSRFKKSEAI
mmetsp:Transcript_86919/g.210869  ORF Transcript_86919/g.210869 Transcript_86919/m.210869 type:complete len:490 (+) Transcript_86919:96-1565(+)